MGHDPDRTPRTVAKATADGRAHGVALAATDAPGVDDPRHRHARARSLSDPGSSRLVAQLASQTDEGATLHATQAVAAGRFDAALAPGDRLFHIARRRVAA